MLRTAAAYGRRTGSDRWSRLAFLEKRVNVESLYVSLRGFFAPEQVSRLIGLGPAEVDAAAPKAPGRWSARDSGRGPTPTPLTISR